MTGYLLATNVISEAMRRSPHGHVVTFLAEHDDLWLSSVVLHELEYGVQRLPQGQRRASLQVALLRFTSQYEGRILPLDRTGAEWAAPLRVQGQRSGHPLGLGDAPSQERPEPTTSP